MAKNTRDHHNNGQNDRASGKGYKAPNGFFDEWAGTLTGKGDKVVAENKAYRNGWRNAEKQD